MNLLDVLTNTGERSSLSSRINGVVVGVVTNNDDPDGLGRVKVEFVTFGNQEESHWARIATPMAGPERGFYFLPEVGDEVLVTFEQGDPRFPFVVGALWSADHLPPQTNDQAENNIRSITSRSGHIIRLNDTAGGEKIEIIDSTGNNSIEFDSANNTITIVSGGDITLSAKNGTIKLDAQAVEIDCNANFRTTAGGDLNLVATGTMTVQGAVVNIN